MQREVYLSPQVYVARMVRGWSYIKLGTSLRCVRL